MKKITTRTTLVPNPISKLIFKAAKSNTPLSENTLLKIQYFLDNIPNITEARKQEISIYQQMQQDFPEITISKPINILDSQDADRGYTALMCAILYGYGHEELAQKLINANANPNIQDHHGNTALMFATNRQMQKIVHALLSAKANPNIQNEGGTTALMVANSIYLPHEGSLLQTNIIQLLIDAKANPDIQDKNGDTALIHAIKHDNQMSVHNLIVDAKANPNIQNDRKETALIWAVLIKSREIAYDLIVNAKANIELADKFGDTALDKLTAAPLISLLLSHHAKIGDPEKLLNILRKHDQRDPDVLISLGYLSNYLDNREEKQESDKNLHHEVKTYMEKLKKLTERHQKNLIHSLSQVTTIAPDCMKIISEYDMPLEEPRVQFFKPADIDPLLQEEKVAAKIRHL